MRTTMQTTKMGKLLKILTPIAMGGAVGATSGNWRVPGSGGQAAENFFANQNAQAMQRAQFGRQYQSDQFKDQLEFAKAQHELNTPYLNSAALRPWQDEVKMPDGSTETHNFSLDPYDPNHVLDRGKAATPPAKTPASRDEVKEGNNGYYSVNPETATGRQVTVAGGTPIPSEPSTVIPGTSEEEPGQPQIPLMPPEKQQPDPTRIVRNRDAGGTETDTLIHSRTGQPVTDKPVATRAPLPKKPAAGRPNAAPDKAKVEQYAQAALEAAGGDANAALTGIDAAKIPPEVKAAVRGRIREIKRPGEAKKKFSLSPEDMAKLLAAPK